MPTKNELKTTALELASKLEGVELSFDDDISHAELTELVKDLNAKATDAATTSQADQVRQVEQNEEDAVEAEANREPSFVIAPGKAIICKRGIKGEGNPIIEGDLTTEQFESFFSSGHIVRQ